MPCELTDANIKTLTAREMGQRRLDMVRAVGIHPQDVDEYARTGTGLTDEQVSRLGSWHLGHFVQISSKDGWQLIAPSEREATPGPVRAAPVAGSGVEYLVGQGVVGMTPVADHKPVRGCDIPAPSERKQAARREQEAAEERARQTERAKQNAGFGRAVTQALWPGRA